MNTDSEENLHPDIIREMGLGIATGLDFYEIPVYFEKMGLETPENQWQEFLTRKQLKSESEAYEFVDFVKEVVAGTYNP